MMKKYKPFVSLFFAVLLLLAACNRQISNPTAPSETGTTDATKGNSYSYDEKEWAKATAPAATYPGQSEIQVRVQYLPAVVDNPDNLPVLKWLYLAPSSVSYSRVWSEEAAVEVNQMLADRNMPFRVQFAIYVSDSTFVPVDWLSRPEIQEDLKTADLIMANFPVDKVEEYLEPLTKYITGNAEPSLKNAVPHEENWLSTTKNGEIYGISAVNRYPMSAGWRVDPKVFTEFGLTEADFQKEFWKMDEVLAKIYEKNGNKPFFYIEPDGVVTNNTYVAGNHVRALYPSGVSWWMQQYYPSVASAYGVDFSQENPTVVNILDTEECRKIQAALKRYSEAGYVLRNLASKDENTGERITLEYLLDIFYLQASESYPDWGGKLAIPVTPAVYKDYGDTLSLSNSVLAASGHKEEAIALLSLIAEDEAFQTHLLYGKEGRDYTVEADGSYKRITQADGSSYNLNSLSPWAEFSDFSNNSYDVVYEGMTKLETYQKICDDEPVIHYWVPFDLTGLEKEENEVLFRARYYLRHCSELTEEEYNTMLADISAAGGDKIQAELQKQLDEWVKANPDKVAANRQ